MIGFLKAILGQPSVFKEFGDGGFQLDTRDPVAMVREWNLLRAEERQLNADLGIAALDRSAIVSKRKRAIEDACVLVHRAASSGTDISALAATSEGWDISRDLLRCDCTGIDILKVRIAKKINADNAWIAQKVLARLAVSAGSEAPDTPELRATLSDLIWFLVAAYYEIEVVRDLGEPDNVFVALNVRDLFSSGRHTYYQRSGVEADKDAIAGWIGAFSDFLPPLPTEATPNDVAQLGQLLRTVSTQGVAGGMIAEMSEVLADAFYKFTESREGSVHALIGVK